MAKPRLPESANRREFFTAIAEVMKNHPEVSRDYLLAEVPGRSSLKMAEASGECEIWAYDPVTGEWYCLK